MLRRFWRPLVTSVIAALVCGCAHIWAYNAAVDNEKQGAYTAAAKKAAEAVHLAHDYPEARALWDRVWAKALADYLRRTADAETKGDWANAVTWLEDLDSLVQSAKAADLPTPMEPIAERLNANRRQAAEVLYVAGLKAETEGRLKDAAINFRYIARYVANYKDAPARYRKDREAAIVRVAVVPFENASGYPGVSEQLSDKLLSELLNHQGEFVTYVNRQHADSLLKEASLQASGLAEPDKAVRFGKLAGARYLVVGQVTQVDATTPERSDLREDAARVVRDAQGRDLPVSVTYTHHKITHHVLVTASLQILDVVDGSVVKVLSQTEEASDTAEWIDEVLGDDRALDFAKSHLRYASNYPKSHAQLITNATNKLCEQFAGSIRQQFD